MKYKQTYIPEVPLKSKVNKLKLGELKKFAKEHYDQNLAGKTIVNKDRGINVIFSKKGVRHTIYARNVGYIKLKGLLIADQLLKYAEYTNYKEPDADDIPAVLGYLNFKSKAKIEGEVYHFRFVVRMTTGGKFYYDHAVKIKKAPNNLKA